MWNKADSRDSRHMHMQMSQQKSYILHKPAVYFLFVCFLLVLTFPKYFYIDVGDLSHV